MFKKIQAKLKSKKGFTLVELLIVIAVLGIIAAIAVPRFTGVLGGVRNQADVRAAELLAKEIEAEFMVENWTIADNATLTVAAGTNAEDGYNGTFPAAQQGGGNLFATIARAGNVYTLTIYIGSATGTQLYQETITPPIQ